MLKTIRKGERSRAS